MMTLLLLAALGASEPDIDPRPRAPGTVQAADMRALLPQDEDWSLAGEAAPLFKAESWGEGAITTSLGLDARLHVEQFRNEALGAIPGTDNALFLRLTPWASVTFSDRVRVYGALKHGSVAGREASTPAAIDDPLDLHQGFVEIVVGDVLGQTLKDLLVRVGRQELHYGAGRVLAIRAGRIMRDDYDGALVRYRQGRWITDAFGVHGVEDRDDMFNNSTDDGVRLSGLYTSGVVQGVNVDLYAISWQRDDITTAAGLVDEKRHYWGARAYGSLATHWRFDIEATWLSGTIDGMQEGISGYQVGAQVSRTLPELPGRPQPTLEFLYTSGDEDPGDGRSETFLAPQASGLVYEDVNQPLGPGNLAWIKASAPLQIGPRLRIAPYMHAFWRVEEEDGLYTLFNTPLLEAGTDSGDFVGLDVGATARLRLTDHLSAFGYAGHFEPGDVFSGTGRDVSGANAILGLSYRY